MRNLLIKILPISLLLSAVIWSGTQTNTVMDRKKAPADIISYHKKFGEVAGVVGKVLVIGAVSGVGGLAGAIVGILVGELVGGLAGGLIGAILGALLGQEVTIETIAKMARITGITGEKTKTAIKLVGILTAILITRTDKHKRFVAALRPFLYRQ